MMLDIIVRNSALCLDCGDEIVSEYGHHFVYCSCGQVAVDGGLEYPRRVYKQDGRWVDTSILADQPPAEYQVLESIALVGLAKAGQPIPDHLWEAAPMLNQWSEVSARVPPAVEGQSEIEGLVYGHPAFQTGQRVRTNAILLRVEGSWVRTTSRFFRLGLPAKEVVDE